MWKHVTKPNCPIVTDGNSPNTNCDALILENSRLKNDSDKLTSDYNTVLSEKLLLTDKYNTVLNEKLLLESEVIQLKRQAEGERCHNPI